MLHSELSTSCPYSRQPRQIYTGLQVAAVKEWAGRLVARTVTCSLLTASLDLLSDEAAWLPLHSPLTAVKEFNIGRTGELWAVTSDDTVQVSWDWLAVSSGGEASWSVLTSLSLSAASVLLPGSRLWAASQLSSSLLSHRFPLTVFNWSRLSLSSQLSSLNLHNIYAGGREAYSGHVLLKVQGGPLLQADMARQTLVAVPVPQGEEILEVSVVPGHVWLVTEAGSLYLQGRAGQWRRLDTSQLAGARLVSVSISEAGQVWAVDDTGQVFMRLGSLRPPPAHAVPVWLPLPSEDGLAEDVRMVEVVCSSAGHMVWARDSLQRVYARVGLYPELPVGTGWSLVTGLALQRLVVSKTSVWGVSEAGGVYRRLGLSSTNWVGDTWQSVGRPGRGARTVTVGQCDTVWALDQEGGLHQLEVREVTGGHSQDSQLEETDWTVIQQ